MNISKKNTTYYIMGKHMVKFSQIVLCICISMPCLATYADDYFVQDVKTLFEQNHTSFGQSLAFLQKYQFNYMNNNMNWGQNGNPIQYLSSESPIYVFNQGNSIVGIAGILPQDLLKEIKSLRTVRCKEQPFSQLRYICSHQSATVGTLERFQDRVRYVSEHQKLS